MNRKFAVRAVLAAIALSALSTGVVYAVLPLESAGALAFVLLFVLFMLTALLTALAGGAWGDVFHATTPPSRTSLGDHSLAEVGKQEMGTVKWFDANKGYGFILRDSGPEIFVHYRSIQGEGHRVLYEGQRVKFVIAQGRKGLQAEEVVVIAA